MGVRVFRLPAESDGRLNLVSVCGFLYDSGIKTLMVEGGLKVISSFLSTDLVDKVIITISPRFAGGRNVTIAVPAGGRFPELVSITQLQLGDDLIIEGYVKKDDRQETVLH
ncbi:MAG: hypothetical protein E4H36_14990 [Spirochaetales bacterium]|nr:MAG: hypothetical protein E4H36_14990 [Spirochaetales bacterium]